MSQDLVIPVYLNQRVVFDLVAMLQGGIATVTKVSQADREASAASGEATGSFGLSQAFASLLRIDLSGKAAGTVEDSTQRTRDEERVHTPASLFFELRRLMIANKVLVQDTSNLSPKPGDFIEFSSSLKRNPLVESLNAMISLMDFFSGLIEAPKKGKQGASAGQPNFGQIKKQMESLLTDLKAGHTFDLTTDELQSSYRAIVTLEDQYLNDPTLSDLADGTFRVAGKVIRVVPKGSGAISLIRKSAFSRMPAGVLEKLGDVFDNLADEHSFALPRIVWEIQGPVIQVLPLAIYA